MITTDLLSDIVKTANSILMMIDIRVHEFIGNENFADDVTMLAISRTA